MENVNYNKKTRKLFHPLRLIVLLFIFLGLSFTTITLSRDPVPGNGGNGVQYVDGASIDPNQIINIRGVSVDGEVCTFENESSDLIYFIPAKYDHEWTAVKNTTTKPGGNHPHVKLLGCGCDLPWGAYIYHGQNVIAYNTSSVECGNCPSEVRYCNDGTLSGSYTHQSCSAGTCSFGYYCDYANNQCVLETTPCTPYTCNNLSSLAAANEGLNCGLGLNDGCGGTIDCVNNCSSGQVCASCPPGFDDFDDCYNQPLMDNQKGVCSANTICNAVVDVAGMTNQGRSFCIIMNENAYCPANPLSISSFKRIRHINGNCEIYPVNNDWAVCGNHFPTPEPYWVSFNGEFTKTEILASSDSDYDDIIIESCIPDDGSGGTGPGPEEPE